VRALCKVMMAPDPAQRPGAETLLQGPWLARCASARPPSGPAVPAPLDAVNAGFGPGPLVSPAGGDDAGSDAGSDGGVSNVATCGGGGTLAPRAWLARCAPAHPPDAQCARGATSVLRVRAKLTARLATLAALAVWYTKACREACVVM